MRSSLLNVDDSDFLVRIPDPVPGMVQVLDADPLGGLRHLGAIDQRHPHSQPPSLGVVPHDDESVLVTPVVVLYYPGSHHVGALHDVLYRSIVDARRWEELEDRLGPYEGDEGIPLLH